MKLLINLSYTTLNESILNILIAVNDKSTYKSQDTSIKVCCNPISLIILTNDKQLALN